jgi:hypothetical protein
MRSDSISESHYPYVTSDSSTGHTYLTREVTLIMLLLVRRHVLDGHLARVADLASELPEQCTVRLLLTYRLISTVFSRLAEATFRLPNLFPPYLL